MHVYCVIDVKGGLRGWTVLRIGGSERLKGKGSRQSYKRAKRKATNKKQKHKAQESRHQKFLLGVSLTLCRWVVIGVEAK